MENLINAIPFFDWYLYSDSNNIPESEYDLNFDHLANKSLFNDRIAKFYSNILIPEFFERPKEKFIPDKSHKQLSDIDIWKRWEPLFVEKLKITTFDMGFTIILPNESPYQVTHGNKTINDILRHVKNKHEFELHWNPHHMLINKVFYL